MSASVRTNSEHLTDDWLVLEHEGPKALSMVKATLRPNSHESPPWDQTEATLIRHFPQSCPWLPPWLCAVSPPWSPSVPREHFLFDHLYAHKPAFQGQLPEKLDQGSRAAHVCKEDRELMSIDSSTPCCRGCVASWLSRSS